MNHIPYQSRGVRLPAGLWKRIDEEAVQLRMSPGELLRRKLGHAFRFTDDVPKSLSQSVEVHLVDEEDGDGDD